MLDRLKPFLRVNPRDLFNESKLLKCMGQVALLHHDGRDNGLLVIRHVNPTRGYQVEQDQSDGYLYIRNLTVRLQDGRRVWMGTHYNSKDAYPLTFNIDDEQTGDVLNNDGTFSSDFKSAIGLP